MKKIIYIALIIIIMVLWISVKKSDLLPEDSIRFRLIANSNNDIDQGTKLLIKKDLEQNIFKLLQDSSSAEETKKILKENEEVIKSTIEKYNVPYDIKYGKNYFPQKNHKGIIYKEGEYESLVISLGEAAGNNWWCVMYPPLCLLESNEKKINDVEYKSYFQEIITKFIS